MLRAIVNVCYMFVFLLLSQIEILKNKKKKNTYLATNFSKGDIFC